MSFLATPAVYPKWRDHHIQSRNVFLLPLIASTLLQVRSGMGVQVALFMSRRHERQKLHAHAPKLQLLVLGPAFHVIGAQSDI